MVHRTRLVGPQAEMWSNWRYHALIANRSDLDAVDADTYHRAHARVELAIKDLKDTALAQCPSGRFFANGAWLACAALAHNLSHWTADLRKTQHPKQLTVVATTRRRFLSLPGHLVNHSDFHILRLPANWPWQNTFTRALQQVRNLPLRI